MINDCSFYQERIQLFFSSRDVEYVEVRLPLNVAKSSKIMYTEKMRKC